MRFRLIILGFALLVVAFLLVLPEVDPPDATGVEATAATLVKYSSVTAPAVREEVKLIHYRSDRGALEALHPTAEFIQTDLHSSLTLLCLLRC